MASIAIRPGARGGVEVELPTELRDLLESLSRQLKDLLTSEESRDDPGVARLFPPASMDDPLEALGFEQLMGDALLAGKLEAADVLGRTARASYLTGVEAEAWSRALNDVRLVLGTRLEVTEGMDADALFRDPLTEQAATMYVALTELVEMLIRAMDDGTPPGR
jgi:Domain of unknown function (DUF2017)